MNRSALKTLIVVVVLTGGVVSRAFAQDGRYIVKFRDGRSPAGQAALRAAGAEVVLVLDAQGAAAAHIPAAALNGLTRNPNIEYIEVDVIREPFAWSNVPAAGSEVRPYGIQMVQADKITPSDADNRKVCIIDSGYSDQHTDLRDYTGLDLTAKLTDSGSGTWNQDSCGHGSHVAGTIAAIAGNGTGVVGVNPEVALHIVKVFGNNALVENGSCGWTYSSTLVSALNSCRAAGAHVVSMSLGGALKSRTEEQAFNDANKAGVLSIAAAGNAGNNTTSYPAGYAAVMSVAAVDANDVKGSFSQSNKDVEIAAPGVAVLSTTPWLDLNTLSAGTTTWSGGRLDGAPRTTAVGNLVDGGLCTSAGAWGGKVVLCQRGSNSFANKVANVQAGGGSAAVVYNSTASDPTCGVFAGTLGTSPTTTIAAISLSCADGAAAVAAAGAGFSGSVTSVFSVPDSGYEAWDGTSMATPHVSAVAALIWSCHPTKSNQQIRNALTSTALDKGAPGRDNSYGFGIVRAKDALLTGLGGPGSCTVQ
jgi:subtilisin family serine protease